MEYIHRKITDDLEGYTHIEKLIDYNGKQLLALQCQIRIEEFISTFALVPGFIESYRTGKTEDGLEVSKISSIPEEDKEDITKLLRKKCLEGNIIFPKRIKS